MIQFKYGLLSEYQALAEKDLGTLYFITDTHEIFRGTDQVAINNIVYTGEQSAEATPPTSAAADASDNKIYITTSKSGDEVTQHLWMRVSVGTDSYAWSEVGGSGEVKDLDLTAFLDGVVVTVIPEYDSDTHATTATDTSIPTTKAVATAIASSLVDVGYDASGDAAVWTFTAKDGSTKTINTPKENFLQSASYDNTTHDLTLTLSSGDEIVVPLDDLVPSACSTNDVATPTDGSGAITVELGTGGSIGGYKTGDVIAEGTSVQTILKKLLAKQIPPTYVSPTVSIAVGTGAVTSDTSVEIGSMIRPGANSTFTKNNAGDVISHTISCSRNGGAYEQVASGTSATQFIILDAGADVQITSTIKFKSTVSYGEGEILKDNLGDDYPTGHIAAGSISSSELTYSSFQTGYFWGVLNTSSTEEALTAEIIRSALDGASVSGKTQAKDGAYAAGTIGTATDPVIKASLASSPKRIFIACPASKTGVTKVIMPSASNADATGDFKKQSSTIRVPGANNYGAALSTFDYNVWVYEPAVITADQTFVVTLG